MNNDIELLNFYLLVFQPSLIFFRSIKLHCILQKYHLHLEILQVPIRKHLPSKVASSNCINSQFIPLNTIYFVRFYHPLHLQVFYLHNDHPWSCGNPPYILYTFRSRLSTAGSHRHHILKYTVTFRFDTLLHVVNTSFCCKYYNSYTKSQ